MVVALRECTLLMAFETVTTNPICKVTRLAESCGKNKTIKQNQSTDEVREPYFPVDIERLPFVKVVFSTAAPPFVFGNPLVYIKAGNLKPCFSCQSRQPPTTREKFDNLPRFRPLLQGQP